MGFIKVVMIADHDGDTVILINLNPTFLITGWGYVYLYIDFGANCRLLQQA